MDAQEFQDYAAANPAIRQVLEHAASTIPARSFGLPTEMAGVVLLFPVVRFILTDIGLPWLATLRKYSEVQRRRVEDWIDRHAAEHGLNPDEVETAGKAFIEDLEQTTDGKARHQWEHLAELLKTGADGARPSGRE